MDTTKRSTSRRYQQPPGPGIPPSPRLLRSKSGGTLAQSRIHPSPTSTYYYYSPQISTIHRSRSTTKSRTNPNQENFNPIKKPQDQNRDNGNGFAKFWQSNSPNSNSSKRVRQGPTSPSAWALSPGRSLPVTPKSSGSGVSGVLKYFRNRKVGSLSVQQVEYGEYRVSYNRLLQWRFVNARAEASMASVKMLAQKKMFNVWVRILVVRNSIMEMRIEMQKLKNEIKLYKIINSQASLLKEWKRLEGRNCEAVGRVARKLSSTAIRIPLLHGAKADAEAMYDAMSTANIVMANIEATIMQFHSQLTTALAPPWLHELHE
ncbi:hypothetical protein LguiB_029242 [Lonicera macranthoides]